MGYKTPNSYWTCQYILELRRIHIGHCWNFKSVECDACGLPNVGENFYWPLTVVDGEQTTERQ